MDLTEGCTGEEIERKTSKTKTKSEQNQVIPTGICGA
jgi:hypothetical protein